MASADSGAALKQVEALFGGDSVLGMTDRQLLDRFLDHRREAAEVAFAALVGRHGAMVLGVCRQLLDDAHGAEDAFQATFLVLARKARSIRNPERLAPWLYGVARRTGIKARSRRERSLGSRAQGEVVSADAY
jgi:DNA-directed RNA polymerase specialized sigma24 family protein